MSNSSIIRSFSSAVLALSLASLACACGEAPKRSSRTAYDDNRVDRPAHAVNEAIDPSWLRRDGDARASAPHVVAIAATVAR